ncbi:MAG: 30S ribosomal protein S9 [Nitrospirae bacterium]|nr:30S ribosomal protein S9 [Nitrospirota bacterium]
MATTEVQNSSTGKRKTAIARVILSPGSGDISINNKPLDKYFSLESQRLIVRQPLLTIGVIGKYNIAVKVNGGGMTGQAGAIRHSITRALLDINPDFRLKLKKEGLLTRDPRAKERKKYGQQGARKRFQFSKR